MDRLPLARDHRQTGHAGMGVREEHAQSKWEGESVALADDDVILIWTVMMIMMMILMMSTGVKCLTLQKVMEVSDR